MSAYLRKALTKGIGTVAAYVAHRDAKRLLDIGLSAAFECAKRHAHGKSCA